MIGGFWHLPSDEQPEDPDDLRAQLFRLLAPHSPRFGRNPHALEALEMFLAAGLFLLQTLKWPIAKPSEKRRATFNHLPRSTQRRLLNHTAVAHLRAEMSALKPRGVLAMGNAALGACRLLALPDAIPDGGVETVRAVRGLNIIIEGAETPLDVTFLPVDENMRKRERARLIEADIGGFLDRHTWNLN